MGRKYEIPAARVGLVQGDVVVRTRAVMEYLGRHEAGKTERLWSFIRCGEFLTEGH